MSQRRLPPRDRLGRFCAPRTVAAAAERSRSRRRERTSAAAHWLAVVVVPWAAVAWMLLGGRP